MKTEKHPICFRKWGEILSQGKTKYSLRGKVSHRPSHNIPINPYTFPLSFQLQLLIGRGHFSTNFLPIIHHENPSIFPEHHFLFLSRFHLIFSRHQRDFMRTGETFSFPIIFSLFSLQNGNQRELPGKYLDLMWFCEVMKRWLWESKFLFFTFPSLFFSRELLYDGEVFGLKRKLKGDLLGRNLRVIPRSL